MRNGFSFSQEFALTDNQGIQLLPFRRFHYYHPKQNGSASMKSVLPALTGKGYDQLAIQDGVQKVRQAGQKDWPGDNHPAKDTHCVPSADALCRAVPAQVVVVGSLHSPGAPRIPPLAVRSSP